MYMEEILQSFNYQCKSCMYNTTTLLDLKICPICLKETLEKHPDREIRFGNKKSKTIQLNIESIRYNRLYIETIRDILGERLLTTPNRQELYKYNHTIQILSVLEIFNLELILCSNLKQGSWVDFAETAVSVKPFEGIDYELDYTGIKNALRKQITDKDTFRIIVDEYGLHALNK